jgi:membrane-associated phospholipid phosphatase
MTITFVPRCVAPVLALSLLCIAPADAQDLSPADLPPLPPLPSVERRTEPAVAPTPLSSARLPREALSPRPSMWRDLFTDTVRDARRLPSKQTLEWAAIGLVAAAGSHPADSHVGRSLAGARQLSEPLEAGAVIGSTPLQMGMSAATYAVGRLAGWPRMTVVGADLFRAELIAQGLTVGLKESIRRRRPEGSGFAFPSGHTTVSFASATVLQQHLGWRVGAPAYALASYVALSRVQMNRHYLSDVAFGAALGIAAGRTVTFGHERRVRLAPMAADGGGGVQVTWLGRGATTR